MKYLCGILIVVVSWSIGIVCDKGFSIMGAHVYWCIGAIGGFLGMAVLMEVKDG